MPPDPPSPDPIRPSDRGSIPRDPEQDDASIHAQTITTDSNRSPRKKIEALLALGAQQLEVENAYLTRINPGPGSHRIVAAAGAHPAVEEGTCQDLDATFCRRTLIRSTPLSLENASNQGWSGDRAFETTGFETYLGTKVVVGGRLYGTLCFAESPPRSTPFGDADHALVEEIAQAVEAVLEPRPELDGAADGATGTDFLRRVQEVSQVAGWELALDPQTLRWTEQTYRLHELPSDYDPDLEAAIGFYADEDQPTIRSALRRCREAGIPFNEEASLITAEGTRRRVQLRGMPYREDGAITRITGTIRDVTEQHRQERDLLERVFETSPSAIAILNAEGEFIRVSDRAQQILGLRKDEVTSRRYDDPDWQITAPDGTPLPREEIPFFQVKDTREPVIGMEHAITWPDGTRRVLSVSGAPLYDVDDTFIGAVFHLDDVTPHRKAELSLRLFRNAVEQAYEAVLILEGEPRAEPGPPVAYANPAFCSLTGHDAETVRGESLRVLFGPETEPEAVRPLWQALQEGSSAEGEMITYRTDGTPFVNQWSIAPVRDDNERITHWLLVQRDVTEEREASRRLLEAHDEERRRIDQEIHDHMGGLLTALQMTVELARMETPETDGLAGHLDTIEEHVSELSTVARSISRRLQPSVLTDQGLLPAVSSLAERLRERHDLQIDLSHELDLDGRLPSLLEMTAYQVVQETLVHAARQTDGLPLRLRISADSARLRILLRCRTAHFPTLSQTEEQSSVLREVRTWVGCLDGTVDIDASDDGEVSISAALPLSISSLPSGGPA